MFLKFTSVLHLAVNPLHLHSWKRLLSVDFHNDTPTFSRVFLTCLYVLKCFFFAKEKILPSFTLVVCCVLPGCLMLLTSPVHSFFLRMYQNVGFATPKYFAISLIDLFCFYSLVMASFTCFDISFDFKLLTSVRQLPNAKSTLEFNSKPFISFICLEVMREQTTPANQTACQAIIQIFLNPLIMEVLCINWQ